MRNEGSRETLDLGLGRGVEIHVPGAGTAVEMAGFRELGASRRVGVGAEPPLNGRLVSGAVLSWFWPKPPLFLTQSPSGAPTMFLGSLASFASVLLCIFHHPRR